MKKNNVAILLLIFVLIAFSIYYSNQQLQLSQNWKSSLFQLNIFPTSTEQPQSMQSAYSATTEDNAVPSESVSSNFKKWVSAESENLENSVTDAAQKKEELFYKSSNLTMDETLFLVSKIQSRNTSANDKIFSTYLIGLNPEHNFEGLLKIIEPPLSFQGTQQSHSIEETLSMQEKTLRRMAVDALIEGAKLNPEKKSELLSEFQKIQDSGIKEFAMKRIQEIP